MWQVSMFCRMYVEKEVSLACYHPMLGVADLAAGRTANGKYRYKIEGSYNPNYQDLDPLTPMIKIPCGHCLGCRLDQSRQWADRMLLELDSYNGKAIFLTLTYNNEHVPFVFYDDTGEVFDYTLDKSDVQKFMKRLRKKYDDRLIRFYFCGEYGARTYRPHYHAIIYGLGLEDFPCRSQIGRNEIGHVYFTDSGLERVWNKGYILFSGVSYKTCAYVARYVTKKLGMIDENDGRVPVFHLMSRDPGLGALYYKEHPDCLDLTKISLNDGMESKEVYVPKYFLNKLKVDDPDRYDVLCSQRVSFARDSELLELKRTNLGYLEYLEAKENSLMNKTKILFNLREEKL